MLKIRPGEYFGEEDCFSKTKIRSYSATSSSSDCELFILKINKLIDEGEKNILVGAIPRSGKSYIMAGTILEYVKKQEQLYPGKKIQFLLITPAPNETFGEYETIFNKYIENKLDYRRKIKKENLFKNKIYN